MIRRNKIKKKVLAILTADWHLRDTQPTARTDNFWETQWKKVQFISELQREHECPVIHSGDLFEHWKASPYLLSKTLRELPERFFTVYGNHDLPQHNLDNQDKSGVNVLREAGRLRLLPGVHWGQLPDGKASHLVNSDTGGKKILVWHVMTWTKAVPYPGCPDPDAYRILKKYPEYDLILTGHNHKPFVAEMDGRILLNPGCITRQEADQTHEPRVWLYYGDAVEPMYLPIPGEPVLTRAHLDGKKERDERIEAFVSKLNDEWETTVSFRDNLERFFSANQVRTSVQDIVYKALD